MSRSSATWYVAVNSPQVTKLRQTWSTLSSTGALAGADGVKVEHFGIGIAVVDPDGM